MKKIFLPFLLISAIFISGCEKEVLVEIDTIPAAPQGVYSVTGDGAVYIYFNGPYERDINHYIVLRSFEEFDNYAEVGIVSAVSNPSLDLIYYEYVDGTTANSITYFYAVISVDNAGQRSSLSAELVFDTPRPEGPATLQTVQNSASSSGFSFLTKQVVSSSFADFFISQDPGTGIHSIIVGNAFIDIQDMGYTETFDDVDVAPQDGWSNYVDVELITGHTYVLWTDTDNYAKIRIELIFPSGAVSIRWAYQEDVGNPELTPEQEDKTLTVTETDNQSVSLQ